MYAQEECMSFIGESIGKSMSKILFIVDSYKKVKKNTEYRYEYEYIRYLLVSTSINLLRYFFYTSTLFFYLSKPV